MTIDRLTTKDITQEKQQQQQQQDEHYQGATT
jgi:hypothetical protein